MARPICYLDTETSGLSRQHEIIELAAVILDGETKDELHAFGRVLIKPTRWDIIDRRSLEISGITLAQLRSKEAEDPTGAFRRFCQWLFEILKSDGWRATFAGHNPSFDKRFLQEALTRFVRPGAFDQLFHPDLLDTQKLATPLLKRGVVDSVKLANLAAHFKIPHVAHTAMGDVRAGAELLRRLSS